MTVQQVESAALMRGGFRAPPQVRGGAPLRLRKTGRGAAPGASRRRDEDRARPRALSRGVDHAGVVPGVLPGRIGVDPLVMELLHAESVLEVDRILVAAGRRREDPRAAVGFADELLARELLE